MRRVAVLLLVSAVVFAPGQLSVLHTHVYTDHDHPEHHHGPAAHADHQPAHHQDDDQRSLEPCDPGRHAWSMAMACAPASQTLLADGACATLTVVQGLIPVYPVAARKDVRVHGPPLRTQFPPRAPPLIVLA